MVQEALALKHPKIYTRADWANAFPTVLTVPDLPYQGTERHDDPFHWGSGPYAVLLGCTLADELDLIGFDLYGDQNKINNVYKGTQNYNNVDHRAIDPRYWIAQIATLMKLYPEKNFTIHQAAGWKLPKSWGLPNVLLDNSTYFS